MFHSQKTTPILVPDEEKPFVSTPRRESLYCEDCDTISVRIGAACGVCRSYATLPPSRLLQATLIKEIGPTHSPGYVPECSALGIGLARQSHCCVVVVVIHHCAFQKCLRP
jgi:hypothetical protein